MNYCSSRFLMVGMSFCACAILWPGQNLHGEQISRYLYLDHWAYRYIDLLQVRGYMGELNRSVRPYRRAEVAGSVSRLSRRSARMSEVEEGWLELLKEEFKEDILFLKDGGRHNRIYYVRGIARESADVRGDNGDSDYFFSGEALLRFSSLVFSSRITIDQSLFDAPNYMGRKDISLASRVEDSYLMTGLPAVSLFYGRTDRTWSPFPDMSLLLSENPFSYDHLFLRIGGKKLALRGLVARLSDTPSGVLATEGEQRYLAAHRVDFRLGDWIQMGIFESVVYGGKGKGLDLAFSNPFSPYIIIENGSSRQANSFIGCDLFLTPWKRLTVSTQLLIDDVKLSLFGKPVFYGKEVEPDEFGFAVGSTFSDPFGLENSLVSGRYLRISNYTYNTLDPVERYLQEGVNIGSRFGNDMDHLMFGIDYFPLRSWIITATTAFQRKGEGRVTETFPAEFARADYPFPSGTVEKTLAADIDIRFQPSVSWVMHAGVGLEDVRNEDNVDGVDKRRMRGNLGLQVSWARWWI